MVDAIYISLCEWGIQSCYVNIIFKVLIGKDWNELSEYWESQWHCFIYEYVLCMCTFIWIYAYVCVRVGVYTHNTHACENQKAIWESQLLSALLFQVASLTASGAHQFGYSGWSVSSRNLPTCLLKCNYGHMHLFLTLYETSFLN